MEQTDSDLLLLLGAYTSKHNSAVVETDAFIQSVTAAIRQKKTNIPGIGSFLEDTKNTIYKTLDVLSDQKKVFMKDGNVENIYFLPFYQKQIGRAYEYIDTSIETPFPGDAALSIPNLPDLFKSIGILNDFTEYMLTRDETGETDIVRLVFAQGHGGVFALASMIPKTILQIAMFKLRDYLYRYGSNDFFQGKLKSYFSGKEMIVQDYFKNIMAAPEKSIALIASGNDFSSAFWSYLYSLINTELQHQQVLKGSRSAQDIALYQASTIILACNNYYQTIALNERDKFKTLSIIEGEMDKPPYYYTLEEIGRFKNDQGQEIFRSYSPHDLAEYFKQKLKAGDSNTMPPILLFHGPQKEIWYAKKDKIINLCENLINEASRTLRTCLETRWHEIIKNYQTENTMYDDFAFEQLIRDLASAHTPHLIPIMWDAKLKFILEEQKDKGAPAWLELFHSDDPVTLRKALGFKQNVILHSVYAGLPFWYSNKLALKIIGFIKHGAKREIIFKKKPKTAKAKDNRKALDTVDQLVKNLIREQKSIDSELDALAEQWNQLLNKTAQKDLRHDVDSIVNAKISFEMKTLKFGNLTLSIVEDIAESLIASNNTLKKIHNKKALSKYIMLAILKWMKNTGSSKRVS
jgi:hypothetical protein